MIPRPLFTYAASPVHYNDRNISVMNDYEHMKEPFRKKAQKKYGLDFSKILTPAEEEKSRAMKIVANECLPSHRFKPWAMLNVSHDVFSQATYYLVCAMETQKERLCDPAERQRLVEQLMAYRTLRQHLIGYEQAYARMVNNPVAKKMIALGRQMMEGES